MADDPLNKTFAETWARPTRDLLFDSEGNLQFKTNLWSDVRHVILPTLVDKVWSRSFLRYHASLTPPLRSATSQSRVWSTRTIL
jgi:hypothetical protein